MYKLGITTNNIVYLSCWIYF